jgi:ABC-type glutathione transport system ATPase component
VHAPDERRAMSVLTVERLTITGPAGALVRDLSFALAAGQALSLAGPSGSGKTLTALALVGLLPPGIMAAGSISLAGTPIIGAPEPVLRHLRGRVAGFVFQDPGASLDPLMTAGQHIAQALALHGTPRAARAPRIATLMTELGLDPGLARRHPHRLSGGERQRVAIAIALATDPALLIADEPTTSLDASRATEILDLLTRARARRGLALLLITHDSQLAGRYAGCRVHLGAPYFPAARPPLPAHAGDTRLMVRDLTVRHRDAPIIDRAGFTVAAGETLGLTGASGAGKTTLAYALFGLTAHTGQIILGGRDVQRLSRRERARAQQLVLQNPALSLPPGRTIAATLDEALALHRRGQDRAARAAEIRRLLAELGLDEAVWSQRPPTLSGGQAQRVALARALLVRPQLLVLDEPTSGLDAKASAALVGLLAAERAARNLTMILISHDTDFIAALAHRTLTLAGGTLS